MSVYNNKDVPLEYLVYKVSILKKSVLIICAVSIVVLFFSRAFLIGFLVGGLISVANFLLLWKHILKMRDLSLGRARKYIISKFFVMYLIMAITLFSAITKGIIVFIGAALGLLVVKFTILAEGILARNVKSA